METQIIVANFKSHMNEKEAKEWLNAFIKQKEELQSLSGKEIIIASSFTLLSLIYENLQGKGVKFSAQDVSSFDEGAYTGEVNAKQLKDYAEYVIIGHSERRTNLKESDEMLSEKVKMALKYGLKPIYCVQSKDTIVPEGVGIIAYEPLFAIGSGNPDTPQDAMEVSRFFIEKYPDIKVLYGGSVTPADVTSFTKMPEISGVLVGGGSLDPIEFLNIIKNA